MTLDPMQRPMWDGFDDDREPPGDTIEGEGPPDISLPDHPLTKAIVEALRDVYDPEIPVNIYDLGLVYTVTADSENVVSIEMTLTAPACPVADLIPAQVAESVESVEAVKSCSVELVWDPPWDQSKMSEEARLALGFD